MSVFDSEIAIAEAIHRLRAASDEDRAFDAAQMQLINLPEIIKSAGEHWPLIKDRIRSSSTNFLRGCLSDDDIVLPAGDGFLIIFARGEPEALQLRTRELRDLLLEFYLGDEAFKRLGVSGTHCQISSADLGAFADAGPLPNPLGPSPTSCVFAPVWTPRAQLVVSYACIPVHRDRDGVFHGYDRAYAETGRNEFRNYSELDLDLLETALSALDRYGPGDVHPALGISVHSTTMQNRAARSAYLDRLAKASAGQLKHLYLKIAEIEPGAPIINLADWAGMLRVRVRNIVLEFHHSEQVAPDLREVGVWGAGYRAPSSAGRGDAIPLARQLQRWGESLTRQRVCFFVDHLSQPGLARLAVQAGARFLSGEPFWPFQKWPGGVVSAPAPFGAADAPMNVGGG